MIEHNVIVKDAAVIESLKGASLVKSLSTARSWSDQLTDYSATVSTVDNHSLVVEVISVLRFLLSIESESVLIQLFYPTDCGQECTLLIVILLKESLCDSLESDIAIDVPQIEGGG